MSCRDAPHLTGAPAAGLLTGQPVAAFLPDGALPCLGQGRQRWVAGARLRGAGRLLAYAGRRAFGAAVLVGRGGLTASGVGGIAIIAGAAVLVGRGALAAAAGRRAPGAAALIGRGRLTAAATVTGAGSFAGAAVLIGRGFLAAVAGRRAPGAAVLVGRGTLAAAATVTGAGGFSGAAVLVGRGTLAAAAGRRAPGAAALAGRGTLAAAAGRRAPGAAVLAGRGTLAAAAGRRAPGAAVLVGRGTLAAAATVTGAGGFSGAAVLVGRGTLAAAAGRRAPGAAALAGRGTLAAAAGRRAPGAAVLAGRGTLAAAATVSGGGPSAWSANYTTGVYSGGSFAAMHAFSRASVATWYDGSGVLQSAAVDVARLTHDGTTAPCLYLEGVATNHFANSVLAGGTVGVLRNNGGPGGAAGVRPTGTASSASLAAGLTEYLHGVGTDAQGRPYIDWRIAGTATGSGNVQMDLTGASVIDATASSVWMSFPGATTGLSTSATGARQAVIRTGGTVGTAVTFTAGGATPVLRVATSPTQTAPRATAARLRFDHVAGAVDIVCRIAAPQHESGAVATSWISTNGSAVARAADAVSITGIANATYDVVVTYDDSTTLSLPGQVVTGGTWAVPVASLTRPRIASITGTPV